MKFTDLVEMTSCIAFYQVTQPCDPEDSNFLKEKGLKDVGHTWQLLQSAKIKRNRFGREVKD
jgi:hypothetical protein